MREGRARRDVVRVLVSVNVVRNLYLEVSHVGPSEHLGRDICQFFLQEVIVLVC